jgi:hypothetical protein
MESPRESGGFLFYALAVLIKIRKPMVDRSTLVLLSEAWKARSLFVGSLPDRKQLALAGLVGSWLAVRRGECQILVINLLPKIADSI